MSTSNGIDTNEFCKRYPYLAKNSEAVRYLVRTTDIPHFRVRPGGKIYFNPEKVDKWIEQRQQVS